MTLQPQVHLHIDSLDLVGVKIARSQRPQIQTSLEVELARLFAVNGIPERLRQSGRIPKLPMNLVLFKTLSPEDLGKAIAREIYVDLNRGEVTHDL